MKKIAILIGNLGSSPYMNSVSTDIERMKAFLKSSNGDEWLPGEIKESRLNPS
jgi:hypothetical protein